MHSKMPKRPDVTQQELPNPGLTLPPNKVAIASNIVVTLTITTTIIIIIDKDNDKEKDNNAKHLNHERRKNNILSSGP